MSPIESLPGDRDPYPPDPKGHPILVTRTRIETAVVWVVSREPVDAARNLDEEDWELLDESYTSEHYDA